ncbi:outer membrane protein [Hoeflea olei]|uniref:Outer membrane protein beta-barrel domain-containing protein n=1 Tax=Hoeflea olei TaxID=1480615 RepID=A0A1C1Z0Q2_9HYPH|nr:outer membrane protein [Hoeflea olei]OCW59289.1 hypothetical protein AWJ14_09585 [Hoeflea olei]
MFMRIAVTSSILALTGLAAPVLAADLDEIILAPELPMTQPVEVGSGWYLRGDLGYSVDRSGGATSYSIFSAGPPASYTATPFTSAMLDGDWSGSLGVGYHFTDYFRGDLTFDYAKGDFTGTTTSATPCAGGAPGTSCASTDTQGFKQYGLMANAYLDLGTFAGFTPYVGAGAGMTRVNWGPLNSDQRCVPGGGACGAAPADIVSAGSESWRFTYALMAGMSYDIAKDWKLDVGYKYSKIRKGDQFGFDPASITAGAQGARAGDNGFENHEIRVGLRYSLW